MKAVVITPVVPLFLRPSRQCELADEGLFGSTVEILEETCPGWCRVRTHYRYEGYAPKECLLLGDGNGDRWDKLEKRVVLRGYVAVLAAPDVQSWPVAEVTRGGLVAPVGGPDEGGWQKVSLPDGREGYTKEGFLGPHYTAPSSEDRETLRELLCQSARLYLGSHYRWGGKSPLGLDCSGLTAMAYLLNGIVIYRDAHIKEGFPLREIPREKMEKGDLIFFPGHVALYLGEDRYIHSTALRGSDGVVVNSLNPQDPDYRPDLPGKITAIGSIFP